ncbi:MAG: hypothetical protein KTR33_03745 [Gammaproteobacteria bacterium]|nr:hypothetical protein [Gammaproteobacteria bacterium]
MRLLGPYMFILVGVFIGLLTTSLFQNKLRLAPNIIVGVLGSFFGLWLRDILDWQWGGNLSGALAAAALGALVTTVALNLTLNQKLDD